MMIIALPLYNPTRSFSHHLELFEACGYKPTRSHHLVKAWLASEDGSQTGSGLTLTSQSHAEDRRNAANVLSETGRDLSAFGDALAAIQLKAGLDGGALTSTPPMRNTVWAN
jgi:dual specificity phosphatase 12